MVHHIEFVTPRAGQLGTTAEVTIEGSFIKEAKEALFYRPGIRCVELKSLPLLPEPRSTIHGGFIEGSVMAKFQIDADCPLGLHPFKLRTATELTTLSTFAVTRFPIVKEAQEDQSVPMNSAVLGRMDTNQVGDVDMYRVTGRKGEHLSVEVDSVWLTEKFYAGSEFDLTARILDASGKELARNDDSALHLQDPIISIVVPIAGDYFVEVKQRLMKAAERCFYVATIGNHPRPLVVYPAGGKAGTRLDARLLGDPEGVKPVVIALPEKAGDFAFHGAMPSPLPMRVSAFENVLEQEGAAVTPVPLLPAALNGIISKPGEVDVFSLKVKQGERWRVRVFARGLGTPLDPRISIRAEGAEAPELEADDSTMAERGYPSVARQIQRKEMLDPSVIWEPKNPQTPCIGLRWSLYRIKWMYLSTPG